MKTSRARRGSASTTRPSASTGTGTTRRRARRTGRARRGSPGSSTTTTSPGSSSTRATRSSACWVPWVTTTSSGSACDPAGVGRGGAPPRRAGSGGPRVRRTSRARRPRRDLGGEQPPPGVEREEGGVRDADAEVVRRGWLATPLTGCGAQRPGRRGAQRGRRAPSARASSAPRPRRRTCRRRPAPPGALGDQPLVDGGDGGSGDAQVGGQRPGRREPVPGPEPAGRAGRPSSAR